MFRVFVYSHEKVSPSWVSYQGHLTVTKDDLVNIAISVCPQKSQELVEAGGFGSVEEINKVVKEAFALAGYENGVRIALVLDSDAGYSIALAFFRFAYEATKFSENDIGHPPACVIKTLNKMAFLQAWPLFRVDGTLFKIDKFDLVD